MDSDNFIGVWDGVFTDEECGQIIRRFDDLCQNSWTSHHDGGSPQNGDEQFEQGALWRKDTALFFDHVSVPHSTLIQNRVGKCMEEYAKRYPGLANFGLISFMSKVQKTPPMGGFHAWHCEHGPDVTTFRRVAVWAVYLTTHETDGETEFLQQGIRVAPQAGRVVIWPAGFTHPHRGNPVYDKDKYIATGWFEFYLPPYGPPK